MSRPPLALGTMGEIRYYSLAGGRYRANANYRDFDGVTRRVERVGRSKAQARTRLKEACRDRGRTDAHADITPDTTVTAVAQLWFEEIQAAVAAGDRSRARRRPTGTGSTTRSSRRSGRYACARSPSRGSTPC